MKQIEKLYAIISAPRAINLNKNTRVYKYLCEIACAGIATTGYSDKNCKYIETAGVLAVLRAAGISCDSRNDAPRGGACGERVFLKGAVLRDCLKNYESFERIFLQENRKKYSWDARAAFISNLQK